jgi:hypothetical protein
MVSKLVRLYRQLLYAYFNFLYRRVKKKNQTCKSSLMKKARNDNRAIHGIAQTQTVRDETPLHPPSTWDPTPTSTPFSPQSLINVDSTISRWAEHEPNPDNPPPGVLPNTQSGYGWGLEDVLSVCSEPLPFTTNEHIHSLDPNTVTHQDSVVDGHHQELALYTNHVYDVNMEALNGLSHTHSMDNRHHDMSTMKTEQNGSSRWYLTSSLPVMYHCPSLPLLPYHTISGESHISGTSSTPSFDNIHNTSHSISHPCTPLASEGMAWQVQVLFKFIFVTYHQYLLTREYMVAQGYSPRQCCTVNEGWLLVMNSKVGSTAVLHTIIKLELRAAA